MSAAELLRDLYRAGLQVSARPDGALSVKPRSLVTDDLAAAILAHKPELLAMLPAPTCPECQATMTPSVIVLSYGRGWWCPAPRCGIVCWRPDAEGVA